MKNRKKRLLALGLTAVLAMGTLAGCKGGEEETAALNEDGTVDTSEHVDLKMYLIGERTPDFDEVYDKVNEVLEEKLNCSLSVDFLSWGEHGQKYSLLFSGGEDFDLIFTATSWAHYEQTVAMNGFKPLSAGGSLGSGKDRRRDLYGAGIQSRVYAGRYGNPGRFTGEIRL